ncbi:ABC-2 type transporter [Thermovibrio ammonificans HB-1]|uniref:ABC-2 type transporter n=1 Tax=Thermovibrio ammonificans (strain DSM 15698 / JCM 12110 / HB-1) TaxID=648996 RepID=E8T6P9_THEA1|nr:ABC transporter permease [Thermovibrio ammonificans]ADU96833.1 ABC-2 type transporter [Thermovibrio ammonificans HB-1]
MSYLVLLYKEIVQFLRNRGLLLFAVYAFTLDIYLAANGIDLTLKKAPFYALDRDLSHTSRELISRFPPYYFNFRGYLLNDSQVDEVLLSDRAVGVVVFPPDFERDLLSGRKTEVALFVNGAELSSSYLFSAYATRIILNFLTASLYKPFVEVEPRVFYNQSCSSRLFMAYSELLTMITLFLLLLPASAVVLEKERGNIEMVIVSPLKPELFVAAKAVSMGIVVLLFTAFALLFTVKHLVGVKFAGSYWDFLLLTAVYTFAATGLSMFIAAVSENMLQVSQLTILILIPILYLSGNWTPIDAMPRVLQWLSVLSPLKYYVNGAFSIAIKGLSVWSLKRELFVLLLQGIGLFGLGTVILKRRR